MGSLPEVFFESMDLKVLLLLTIFAISVASIRGEEEEVLDLPVPPPASLVEFLDQIELNRQGGNGGNWMSNWWKKSWAGGTKDEMARAVKAERAERAAKVEMRVEKRAKPKVETLNLAVN